jgi:5-methylphenazine-1-carboxylate 1-monooxygenase
VRNDPIASPVGNDESRTWPRACAGHHRGVHVVVIGGGIGGCALALSLHAAGVQDVDVYEAVGEVRELGVGINVLPHAIRELTELDLFPALDRLAVRTGALAYHDRFGSRIWTEPRGLAAGYTWPQLSIHRGELLGVLHRAVLDRLGADRFHTGHRLVSFETADDSALARLVDRRDGRHITVRGDVLVGCDGVHSTVRALLVPDEGPPLWNGVTMWRGVTRSEPFLDGRTMVMAGVVARRVVVYPIRDLPDGRQLLNWVAEVRTEDGRPMPRQDWDAAASVDEPLRHFASFRFDWLDVPSLIEEADGVLQYPMVDRDPLPQWRSGRSTLLGDAAHPMYPVGSNGASQAIIDARVLARELALQPTVDDALDAYEAQRRPVTTNVVLANRRAGPEQCMEIVAERAPDGFSDLDSVITQAELEEISRSYKLAAGFDPAVLNDRPSLSVSGGTRPEARRRR